MEESKQSIASGNDKEYMVSSRRYSMLEEQVGTISNMVEMAQSMTDVIEMQQGLKDVVEIGNDLGIYRKQLGINTVQLESAITNIRIREGQCCYQYHDLGYGCGYEWWPGTD